ncbi:MAG: hypothetical protein MUE85_04580 [Microscillaceae bacterium]|jgi:hypothetical protein|nr:hypothetical protein [Microscillaceae bacterium]
MKYLQILAPIAILLIVWGFQPQLPTAEKELMTLVITGNELGTNLKARISVNGEEYTQENLSPKVLNLKEDYNFNPVLRLLREYQRGGWRIVSNNMSVLEKNANDEKIYNYFLLEREKPAFKK